MEGLKQMLSDLNKDYEHLLEAGEKINSFWVLNTFTVLSVITILTRQVWILPAIAMTIASEVIRRYAMYCHSKAIEEHINLRIVLTAMMARFKNDDYSHLRQDTSKLDCAFDVYDNYFLRFEFWGRILVISQWLAYILSSVVVAVMCLLGTIYLYELLTY